MSASASSKHRSEEFLTIADQFQLGSLTTESSHPVTANLSDTASRDIVAALKLLFEVDRDVLRRYEAFAESGQAQEIARTMVQALRAGGRLFFTGCGSTGRLSILLVSMWRDFWQQQAMSGVGSPQSPAELENRAFAVMAGGDYALIKAVEGFEDFTEFGKKQLGDMGVSSKDVVFAITEGGETSFVIGTAWKGVDAGARTYFVYNNPDEMLCSTVTRSREIIQDPRITKINLTTGPMAITGSTRMQATSIQLAVLATVLEMCVRELMRVAGPAGQTGGESIDVPKIFRQALEQMLETLRSQPILSQLAGLVEVEETVYRQAHKNNYFANHFGIDVLTDTTERSPTFCTPPFRKYDDETASDSWAFLFVPETETPKAWQAIIKHEPRCVAWADRELEELVPSEKRPRTSEILRKISGTELMRFRIGLDGLGCRPLGGGDSAMAIVSEKELKAFTGSDGFYHRQLEAAEKAGAETGLIYFGSESSIAGIREFLPRWQKNCRSVLVPAPSTGFLLDGVTRIGLKLLLNALSTCTMVRLGRVMGNYMIWVVPSNLKLIDRATRYISKLTGLDYQRANELLFEVIEYIEPRMKADQAYPPVVGLAVTRVRYHLDNAQAEKRFFHELQLAPTRA